MSTRYISLVSAAVFMLVISIAACKKDPEPAPPEPPVSMTPYELSYPSYFPRAIVPGDNKMYAERVQLGRMLYYDPILSNDGRACASCHHQDKGFTVGGLVGGMPVLPHINLAWSSNFMWDGSEQGSLEDVMRFEVEEFFGTDLQKVNANTKYRDLFKKYYGASAITYKELSYALAQFVRTQISENTAYDLYVKKLVPLERDAWEGMRIFMSEKGDCFHCHTDPMMSDNQFHNIGLDGGFSNPANQGLYHVTGLAADLGRFRTPTLRNVALRSQYMHDGRFTTLEEVVEHYNSGVRYSATLDPIMTKPGKENGLNLTAVEKQQLVAFLRALTDTAMITNPALGKP